MNSIESSDFVEFAELIFVKKITVFEPAISYVRN